jgi:hypothetical protein
LRVRALCLTVVALAITACGGPTGPSGSDQFHWTFDGQPGTASRDGMGALRGGTQTFLSGVNCDAHIAVNIQKLGDFSVGTFDIGSTFLVAYTADTRTNDSASRTQWAAGNFSATIPKGTGTVSITEVSDSRIAGSFDVVMVAEQQNQSPATKTLTGSFRLTFGNGKIC